MILGKEPLPSGPQVPQVHNNMTLSAVRLMDGFKPSPPAPASTSNLGLRKPALSTQKLQSQGRSPNCACACLVPSLPPRGKAGRDGWRDSWEASSQARDSGGKDRVQPCPTCHHISRQLLLLAGFPPGYSPQLAYTQLQDACCEQYPRARWKDR